MSGGAWARARTLPHMPQPQPWHQLPEKLPAAKERPTAQMLPERSYAARSSILQRIGLCATLQLPDRATVLALEEWAGRLTTRGGVCPSGVTTVPQGGGRGRSPRP